LFILEGEAEITLVKVLALYIAYFSTTVKDIGGDTTASVTDYPVRVMETRVL